MNERQKKEQQSVSTLHLSKKPNINYNKENKNVYVCYM